MMHDPVLEKINILPGPESQLSVHERYGNLGLSQDGANVCGHVVGALRPVEKVGVSIGNHAAEKMIQVSQYIRVRVFLDHQGR